jgi:hypothetical protein
MSTGIPFIHRLPQSGWVLSTELAAAVDISDETIKDWLRDFAIPHKKLGTRTFIDMAAFFENLPDGPTDAPQTTKTRKR